MKVEYDYTECRELGHGEGCWARKPHTHEWGPIEEARFTGNPHRKCQGCSEITLDLDDE